MKISLAEINSKVGDLKYNADLIKKHADIAIKNGAEILITPNFANGKDQEQTGYCGITKEIKEEVKPKAKSKPRAKAKQIKITKQPVEQVIEKPVEPVVEENKPNSY